MILKAKGFVIELTSPYIQSAWEFREKMVWTARLVACYNYLKKKMILKKKKNDYH